jgi:polyhydroxyalkanoate synthesis regulator phasin
MNMSSKKKIAAVAVTAVALSIGTVGVSTANAAKATKSVVKSANAGTTTTGVANPMAGGTAAGKDGHGPRGGGLGPVKVLADLVTKGTITQAQADAIIAAVTAAEAARDALRPPMAGKGGPLGDKLTIVASTLGIDSATVLTRLKAGESLATIAGAKKDALIAALVADETKKIDAAVTAGNLTAAQATELKANLVAHVTAEVNATAPAGGFKGGPMGDGDHDGRGGKGGRGHGGPMGGGMPGGGAPTIPAPTTSPSSKA